MRMAPYARFTERQLTSRRGLSSSSSSPCPLSHTPPVPLPTGNDSFAARFPLSPELWRDWIEDRRAGGGDDCTEDILELYRRAFGDYQCGTLWTGYLETLQEFHEVGRRFLGLTTTSATEYLASAARRPHQGLRIDS